MTQIQKIEQEIASLPRLELAELRSWFDKFDAKKWDQQLEEDVSLGRLDDIASTAIVDFKKGHFKEL